MSTPIPPILPFPDDGDDNTTDGVPTHEVDGEQVLDADVADENVDGAEADRIAAEHGED